MQSVATLNRLHLWIAFVCTIGCADLDDYTVSQKNRNKRNMNLEQMSTPKHVGPIVNAENSTASANTPDSEGRVIYDPAIGDQVKYMSSTEIWEQSVNHHKKDRTYTEKVYTDKVVALNPKAHKGLLIRIDEKNNIMSYSAANRIYAENGSGSSGIAEEPLEVCTKQLLRDTIKTKKLFSKKDDSFVSKKIGGLTPSSGTSASYATLYECGSHYYEIQQKDYKTFYSDEFIYGQGMPIKTWRRECLLAVSSAQNIPQNACDQPGARIREYIMTIISQNLGDPYDHSKIIDDIPQAKIDLDILFNNQPVPTRAIYASCRLYHTGKPELVLSGYGENVGLLFTININALPTTLDTSTQLNEATATLQKMSNTTQDLRFKNSASLAKSCDATLSKDSFGIPWVEVQCKAELKSFTYAKNSSGNIIFRDGEVGTIFGDDLFKIYTRSDLRVPCLGIL